VGRKCVNDPSAEAVRSLRIDVVELRPMGSTAPPTRDGAATRRDRLARPIALGLVVAVAGLVWFAVPEPSRSPAAVPDAGPAPSSTTTSAAGPVTVYGCAIEAGVADVDCTDASVVAEYCNVPRESIATPGTVEQGDGSTIRTFATGAGLPAGTVTRFDDGAGLPEYPMTLECATKRTFGFTAADVDAFVQPA
jgi:hypothetical protein